MRYSRNMYLMNASQKFSPKIPFWQKIRNVLKFGTKWKLQKLTKWAQVPNFGLSSFTLMNGKIFFASSMQAQYLSLHLSPRCLNKIEIWHFGVFECVGSIQFIVRWYNFMYLYGNNQASISHSEMGTALIVYV